MEGSLFDNQPPIRFDGFTDAWEQRKVGDRMCIKSRIGWQALTKSEYLTSGDYYLITGTDIDEQSHTVDLRKCFYVSEERYKMDDKIQVHEGDIIVTKDGTIGKVAMVRGLDKPATLNSHLFVLRDMSGELDNYYLLTVLNSHIFDEFVASTKTGSTLTGMPQKTFVEFTFPVPKYEEQKKIAEYFTNLDTLITLHQRKYDSLMILKKSMLEKMFPKNGEVVPEVRFAGFTDAWEQRKSGDIAPLRGGFAFKSSEYGSEGIPIVRISNILSDGSVGADFAYYAEQEADDAYSLYDGAAVLAMSGATTGKVSVLHAKKEQKYYQNQRVGYFVPTDNCDYDFIKTIMKSQLFADQLSAVLVAGAQPNVSSKEIDGFEFMIPKTKDEQKAIGEYFTNLDTLITLHRRKCDSLKKLKKAMLQKMFI